jgi:hypothetical protein
MSSRWEDPWKWPDLGTVLEVIVGPSQPSARRALATERGRYRILDLEGLVEFPKAGRCDLVPSPGPAVF